MPRAAMLVSRELVGDMWWYVLVQRELAIFFGFTALLWPSPKQVMGLEQRRELLEGRV